MNIPLGLKYDRTYSGPIDNATVFNKLNDLINACLKTDKTYKIYNGGLFSVINDTEENNGVYLATLADEGLKGKFVLEKVNTTKTANVSILSEDENERITYRGDLNFDGNITADDYNMYIWFAENYCKLVYDDYISVKKDLISTLSLDGAKRKSDGYWYRQNDKKLCSIYIPIIDTETNKLTPADAQNINFDDTEQYKQYISDSLDVESNLEMFLDRLSFKFKGTEDEYTISVTARNEMTNLMLGINSTEEYEKTIVNKPIILSSKSQSPSSDASQNHEQTERELNGTDEVNTNSTIEIG